MATKAEDKDKPGSGKTASAKTAAGKTASGKTTSAKTTSGKTAPKKGRKGGRTTESTKSAQTRRYTPPIPKKAKTSPRWMGLMIIALFVLGVLIVILNYAGLLPGGVNNLWLIAAIGAIFAGLITATRYH
jgi:hypothetical protein